MLSDFKDIISGNSTVDTLNYVRLEGGAAYGTDLTRWATVPFPVAGGLEPCCVPYQKLAAFLDRAAGSELRLRQDGATLKLSAGRMRASLPTLAADALPVLPHLSKGTRVSLLKRDLAALVHAMSSESSRPGLKGVCLRDGWAEATDGHRLARRPVAEPCDTTILPDTFVRLLAGAEDERVELVLSQNVATWRSGALAVTSKLVEGKFPDTARLWSVASGKRTTWNRAALLEALKTAALADSQDHGVTITGAEGTSTVQMRSGGGLEFTCECPYEGDAPDIFANIRYLVDAVSSGTGDSAEVRSGGPNDPLVFDGSELVMAMRR